MSTSKKNMANTSTNMFFDANVLLESALKRHHKPAADKLLHHHAGHAYISSLTVHLFVYFASKDIEMEDMQRFLDDFIIVPVDSSHVDWAFANVRANDFEDALQVASAISGGCTQFATFDKTLIKRYRNNSTIRFVMP